MSDVFHQELALEGLTNLTLAGGAPFEDRILAGQFFTRNKVQGA